MQKKFKLLATSSSGLESLVARELRNLEIENVSIDDRSRVFFEGNLATIAKANLWLRTADRVKIVVGEFKARTFDELFENVYALPWAELIPFGSQFPVSKAKAVKSTLHNEPSIQSITKKAIVKKLQTTYHRPEGVPIPENGAKFSIEIALHKDMATVLIDTTGDSLFKRGYRSEKGEAPLKENMAASIILLTNWLANPRRAFVDPTCGSGTFTIEAAMLALNMAPGMNRSFESEHWNNFLPKKAWYDAIDEANDLVDHDVEMDLQGYDKDPRMLKIARQNAQDAEVDHLIHFQQREVKDLRHPKPYGFIIANPPYGERLEDQETLPQLYTEMKEAFDRLDTWSKYVITSYEDTEKYLGKPTKKRKVYNGMIRGEFYQYLGPKPPRRRK